MAQLWMTEQKFLADLKVLIVQLVIVHQRQVQLRVLLVHLMTLQVIGTIRRAV